MPSYAAAAIPRPPRTLTELEQATLGRRWCARVRRASVIPNVNPRRVRPDLGS